MKILWDKLMGDVFTSLNYSCDCGLAISVDKGNFPNQHFIDSMTEQ
jgi:hypothetical protein